MNVVLISRDHRLGAILTMALSAPERLTVLDSPAEVPESLEVKIDAVVLDLPADSRRDAYHELRQRYEGRVVVPVDNAKDTSGWPPDAKRRFLVRPFQVADLIAGVQEPKETSVAERAAKQRRRFRWSRHQVPALPALTAAPARTAEPQAAEEPPGGEEPLAAADEQAPEERTDADGGPETVEFVMDDEEEPEIAAAGQAEAEEPEATSEDEAGATVEDSVAFEDAQAAEDEEDDEALLEELQGLVLGDAGEDEGLQADAAQPQAEPPEDEPAADAAPRRPPLPVQASVAMAEAVALQQWLEAEEAKRLRRRRRLVVANVAGGLVLLLAGVGVGRALAPEQPQQVTTPPQPPQQKAQVHSAVTPDACIAAMDNADQVISYLVAKIRDERLSRSIQAYGANARACRSTGR
jgi:hypothetical protein